MAYMVEEPEKVKEFFIKDRIKGIINVFKIIKDICKKI